MGSPWIVVAAILAVALVYVLVPDLTDASRTLTICARNR